MPLGKSPILQNELMAEGDNQKYLLFNDSLIAIEDSENRSEDIDLSTGNAALTESQTLRHMLFKCSGNTVQRTLTVPISVGSPPITMNRKFAVRNDGTASITVTHNNSGQDLTLPAGETALIYADGTDIISLGGVSNAATLPLQEDGVEVVAALASLNFAGTGFTITEDAGVATITFDVPTAFSGLSDTPADYTGSALKVVRVNAAEDGLEFGDASFTDEAIKTAYENNANTNAFTDSEKSKLASLESSSFKGTYASASALETAHPSPEAGSYAYVDAGTGSDVEMYIYDTDDSAWIFSGGSGGTDTAASIKTKYESNADTNALTDALLTKLNNIETGATADQTAAEIEAILDAYYGGTGWRTGGGTASPISVQEKTADYTIASGDVGGNVVLEMNTAGPNEVTIPSGLTPTGPVTIVQTGEGQTTITAGAGVTINTAGVNTNLRAQFSSVSLVPSGVDEYTLVGDLQPFIPEAALGPWEGARLSRVSDINCSVVSAYTPIDFDSKPRDTSGFVEVANPHAFTIPAGVTKVRLSAAVKITNTDTIGPNAFVFSKNGVVNADDGLISQNVDAGGYNNPGATFTSDVIDVVEGDFFNLEYFAGESFALDGSRGQTWFGIEVVEKTFSAMGINTTVDDLLDVDVGAGPADGDSLIWDDTLSKWVPGTPNVTAQLTQHALRGCLVGFAAATDVAAGGTVNWNDVEYDTDGIWSAGSPTRLTVPTGVTAIRLNSMLSTSAGEYPSAPGIYADIRKNGSRFRGGSSFVGTAGYTDGGLSLTSAVVQVTAGDYFEVYYVDSTGNNTEMRDISHFSMEIVEAVEPV